MRTADFDYPLPPELIAQEPAPQRDQSRLLVLHRSDGRMEHRHFTDLPGHLRAGDVLVLNDSRVIPARLRGKNARTGGEFEILLLEENSANDWWAMLRPGKRARVGTEIVLKTPEAIAEPRSSRREEAQTSMETEPPHVGCYSSERGSPAGEFASLRARVLDVNAEGHRRLAFLGCEDIVPALETLGEMPLPPYIRRAEPNLRSEDRERYQTVYARPRGSVAAPTAGLHFTEPLLEQIRAMGVEVCHVTLHVGLGTFAPVKAEALEEHVMHAERFVVSEETARAINAAKAEGRRVVAVGTTSVRVLESMAAAHEGRMAAGGGSTRIFIHPPFRFQVVDALVTNFHLPCSTLLMLVSAFAAPGGTGGRDTVLRAYAEAVRERYRFFSYGDAMLIL
ncbi:MAG: tRNA preQ1(34) S-adenosylmethionine ribosyltransferase-isomerase QueA [Verrucomicrobia bacterium]|nr:tRNA preQ1(34) S-adenosylmethionine ribosyltransferase-isomerase QueA [Verrucomicrobiota bacterium]